MSGTKRAVSSEPDQSPNGKRSKTNEENYTVNDVTHFGAPTELLVRTASLPDNHHKIRTAFSDNEEGVTGVETLCARITDQDENLIGCAKSLLITRGTEFVAEFHKKMDDASTASAELARDLFDRWGRLKQVLVNHPVRRGSGVWGDEIEYGDIMIVQSIDVAKNLTSGGLAKTMWLWTFVRAVQRAGVRYVFVALGSEHLLDDLLPHDFWRSRGFRRVGLSNWFCYATDKNHPSRSLPAGEDIDPPKDGADIFPQQEEYRDRGLIFASLYEPVKHKLPLHFAITTLLFPDLRIFLDKELAAHSLNASQWTAKDHIGNTILHAAALMEHLDCLNWIRNNLGWGLDFIRNDAGCTAFEVFKDRLDDIRDISEDFRGFRSSKLVMCSLILQDKQYTYTTEEYEREAYGCTCGQCLQGFMPPRMKLELVAHPKPLYDDYYEWGDFDEGGINSYITNPKLNPYLSSSMKAKLSSDETWRTGYLEMFLWIAKCLDTDIIPTHKAILRILNDKESRINTVNLTSLAPDESRAAALRFLDLGGKVADVLRVLFGAAKFADPEPGRGIFTETLDEGLDDLPECRNDLEPVFVAAMCGVENMAPIVD